jgi:hypothetical protein
MLDHTNYSTGHEVTFAMKDRVTVLEKKLSAHFFRIFFFFNFKTCVYEKKKEEKKEGTIRPVHQEK